jgi:hypothetical protein
MRFELRPEIFVILGFVRDWSLSQVSGAYADTQRSRAFCKL